jgi:hypothetical protein
MTFQIKLFALNYFKKRLGETIAGNQMMRKHKHLLAALLAVSAAQG